MNPLLTASGDLNLLTVLLACVIAAAILAMFDDNEPLL